MIDSEAEDVEAKKKEYASLHEDRDLVVIHVV